MHLLIPFAAPLSESGRAAAAALVLPRLQALLTRLAAVGRDDGDELSLSTPHERVLAQALGWRGADGCLPWAARAAAADGIDPGTQAWGQLTPAHWHLGTEQVSLADPGQLALDDAGSRELLEAVRDLFGSEGFAVHYGAPLHWYIAHDSLAALPCASLDRVIGRNVDAWLGSDPALRRMRRLQSEVQMRLHTHPANERRQAQGLLPVNSFWLSGCGVAQQATGPTPRIDARLRRPALGEDWAAWTKAWETLDEVPLAEMLAAAQAGQQVCLTLCGERSAARFETAPRGLLQRLRSAWSPPSMQAVLESL
jgi:hypothetical protein